GPPSSGPGIKGGPIPPGLVRRVKRRRDVLFINFFPDNPLLMMPFDGIEAYDVFFTKERHALRALEGVGIRNLYYLPMYCVPAMHHPITLTSEEQLRYARPISFVGSRYPYRERLIKELVEFPVKLWGAGWSRAESPEIRAAVAGGPVWGRAKLAVYCGAMLSLNHHHPLNDIVGVNTRTLELAAAGACQVVDLKEELPALFKPGEEILAYRDLEELKHYLTYYLAHLDEARAIGENARKRALKEHTLRHRIEEMVDVVEQRFGTRSSRPRSPPGSPASTVATPCPWAMSSTARPAPGSSSSGTTARRWRAGARRSSRAAACGGTRPSSPSPIPGIGSRSVRA